VIISLIAAIGKNRELGLNNKLLWHLPEDFKIFKKETMGHTLLMGRKTFESIGKPLPGRTTIVLTRDRAFSHQGVSVAHSPEEALSLVKQDEELFVCGGAEIYKLFLSRADRLYLSYVDFSGEADAFFPEFEKSQWRVEREESFQGFSFSLLLRA
jgi:dihydrofolate reductase